MRSYWILFHDYTYSIGKVQVQTFFFFAPLFEQSDVHFSTKWKTSPFEALFVGPKKEESDKSN